MAYPMSEAFRTIVFDKQEGVAHLALNRPDRLNAYSVAMRDDFAEALHLVGADDEIGALLITGKGRAFCAGADLSEFGTAPSQVIARNARWQRDVWGQLIGLDKPIVVAVHGFCIGSGVEILLLGDLRIAASDTVFAMPEVQLGMIPAAGGSQTLPVNAGPSVALDLLYTGRRFGAAEAMRYGIVSRVVEPEALSATAWKLADALSELPRGFAAGLKRAWGVSGEMPLDASLDLERRLAAACTG